MTHNLIASATLLVVVSLVSAQVKAAECPSGQIKSTTGKCINPKGGSGGGDSGGGKVKVYDFSGETKPAPKPTGPTVPPKPTENTRY